MYYEERPDLVTVTTVGGKYHTTVNYSIVPSEGGFEVESVTVVTDEPLCREHFGLLVTALVRTRYTADDEFAIARQCVSKVSDYMPGWRAARKSPATSWRWSSTRTTTRRWLRS